MAEATVNLKLSPAEFDLTREAIKTARSRAEVEGSDLNSTPAERQKGKAKALLLKDLGAKLNA